MIKNKLLFFGSYQGTRQLNATDPTNSKLDQLPPLTNDRSAAGLGAVFAGDYGYLGYLVAPSRPMARTSLRRLWRCSRSSSPTVSI